LNPIKDDIHHSSYGVNLQAVIDGFRSYSPIMDYNLLAQESEWNFSGGVPKRTVARLEKKEMPVVENHTVMNKVGIYQSSQDAASAVLSISQRYARRMKVRDHGLRIRTIKQLDADLKEVGWEKSFSLYGWCAKGRNASERLHNARAVLQRIDYVDKLADNYFENFVKNALGDQFMERNTGSYLEDWMERRTKNQLLRLGNAWTETNKTNVAKGFLKSQAKFKAKEGFGYQVEAGQGVAGTDAALNVVMCAVAVEFMDLLQSAMKPRIMIDVGLNDASFEDWCMDNDAHSAVNLQVDISKQDSTHTIAIVKALCKLMLFLGVDDHIVDLLWHSRELYRVEYMGKLCAYNCSFMLRSGEPFTLAANCVMSAMIFFNEFTVIDMHEAAICFKGDDVYCSAS